MGRQWGTGVEALTMEAWRCEGHWDCSGCDSCSLSPIVSLAILTAGCPSSYSLSLHVACQQIRPTESLLATTLCALVGSFGVVVQFMAPAVLGASEDLLRDES